MAGQATILLRDGLGYRRDLFEEGLAGLGYRISREHKRTPSRDDLLLIWNRCRGNEATAARYEQAGATVVIAENGYLPDPSGKTFALALLHHNGRGDWMPGEEPRFPIKVKPWRDEGRHVLVLPQRGIGEISVRMPSSWPGAIRSRLKQMTSREIVVRPHPGQTDRPLEPDLEDAWCVVTWGSGAAIKAMIAGIPCFHELPWWIGKRGSTLLGRAVSIEEPYLGSRDGLIADLSWAQWLGHEIADGTAFRHLLG